MTEDRPSTPTPGNEWCWDCLGHRQCAICEGRGVREGKGRCGNCGGSGRCPTCGGTGELPAAGPAKDAPKQAPARDGAMLQARALAEASAYILVHPCSCGERELETEHDSEPLADGRKKVTFIGPCPSCKTERRFVFSLPAIHPAPSRGSVTFGPGTSQLLDPGELLWVARHHASQVVADPEGLSAAQRYWSMSHLEYALIAVDEVLKFVPPGGTEVPVSAFHSAEGAKLRLADPGQFSVVRLQGYRAGLEELWPRYHPKAATGE